MTVFKIISASLLAALAATSAFAQSAEANKLSSIYACADESDETKRLACYDAAVGRLRVAQERGEFVAVTKEDVQDVERDAFGFSLPSIPRLRGLFGTKENAPKTEKNDPLTSPVREAEAAEAITNPAENEPVVAPIVPDEISEVTYSLVRTKEYNIGKTRFYLDNGQIWDQTSVEKIRIPREREGRTNTVEIRRAAMGSYLLRVNGKGKAIRVRRRR